MNKELNKKISALDPRFRKKIHALLDSMHESISMLYEAASHDEKTGLYNNKFFENIFDMEFDKAKRGKQKLSLIMTDIDFFKKVNDTHGHIKADEILKRLAKIIKEHARKSDIVARFGGEEFIILLPETTLIKAKSFAKRLRSLIKNDKFLKKYNITVSGGITQYKKRDSKKRFMNRVDKALFQAKNKGRDKFIVLE